LGVLLLALGSAAAAVFDCTLTEIGLVPLNDLGPGEFEPGTIGGLYPGGRNTRPTAHLDAGLDIATNQIAPRVPLDPNDPDSACALDPVNGLVGLVSIGMCNTSQEFDAFLDRVDLDHALDDKLVLVNGAQGGKPASDWAQADESEDPWLELSKRVEDAGLHPCQVQVAWIKQAERVPNNLGAFPTHAEVLRDDLETIVTKLVAFYPNVRICYLSSRTRAYTDVANSLNPEPFAYESAFSVRWLIEEQLDGGLPFELPAPVAPWLSWGPYLWTDGEAGRSDGFTWSCSDLEGDFTHPANGGEEKVADQLIAFLKTDATARPWFLEDAQVGTPPSVSMTPPRAFGPAPLTVDFSSVAFDPDGGSIAEYAWTFEDGDFAYGAGASSAASAQKTFPVPGRYTVTLTVTDEDGDWATTSSEVLVTDPLKDTIEPEADAFVRSGTFADANFGLSPFLLTSFGGGSTNTRSFLRFDIAAIPATSASVTLSVRANQVLGGSGVTVTASSVASDSWSETGITWNNQPSIGAELDARFVRAAGVSYRFDVTEFVLAELAAGESQAGFVLSLPTPDPVQARFDSREGTVAPVLEFEHAKPHARRR
jgi:PKD repeat protein